MFGVLGFDTVMIGVSRKCALCAADRICMKWQKSHRIDDEAISKKIENRTKKKKKSRDWRRIADVGSEDARPPRVINCFIRFPNKYIARAPHNVHGERDETVIGGHENCVLRRRVHIIRMYIYTAPRDAWLPRVYTTLLKIIYETAAVLRNE
jgi:hypothetical protein